MPLANVEVVMRHYFRGRTLAPSALTNATGSYRLEFTSTPYGLGEAGNSAAARAEVVAEGYEWYWRDVVAKDSSLVENFPLTRLKRITAGDSIVLSLINGDRLCLGWLRGPCDRTRVAVPADGMLTIVATPKDASAPLPAIEACCVDGNEQGGNPVTIRVRGGVDVDVEVGQPHSPGSRTSESVTIKTSFERF